MYDFTLMRGSQLMIMPVLSNPYIERYISPTRYPHHLTTPRTIAPSSRIKPALSAVGNLSLSGYLEGWR